jgi:hypothetical protein
MPRKSSGQATGSRPKVGMQGRTLQGRPAALTRLTLQAALCCVGRSPFAVGDCGMERAGGGRAMSAHGTLQSIGS